MPRIAWVVVIHVKQAPLVGAVIPMPSEAEGLELVFSHSGFEEYIINSLGILSYGIAIKDALLVDGFVLDSK